ncbi:MAG: hypothetical protein IJ828_11080, partial [Treponema sp.]|nr:hypothetical protein [Treponema sp.]
FVATGVAAARIEKGSLSVYKKLVLSGLVLGMIGDILLELQFISIGFFVAGLISFAAGHIFYVVAFSLKAPRLEIVNFIPMAIVMPAFFLLVFLSNLFDFQGLFPCIVFYGIVLTFMMGKALSLSQYAKKAKLFVCLTITGVTLFAISDIILLFILFMNVQPMLKNMLTLFNLLTYYIGQGLLALSLSSETLAARDS